MPYLSEETIRSELTKAINLFEKLAGFKAKACAAPGWQVTPRSLKVQQELGFSYCSDVSRILSILSSYEWQKIFATTNSRNFAYYG